MQSEEQALDGKPIFFYVEFGVREKQVGLKSNCVSWE